MSSTLLTAFTAIHVAISLVGIASGFVVAFHFLGSKSDRTWTATFLWTTLATSVTGFLFPFNGFTPALAFGILSLVILVPTFYGLYSRKLAGLWRPVYVAGVMLSFYLNFFVLIVQSFLKVPVLNALAPTQKEPPFAVVQVLGLVLFVTLGVLALRRFRPGPV